MSTTWDDSPQAWATRDRHVEVLARSLSEAADIDTMQAKGSSALGYLTLAAKANQTGRLRQWAELFADAQDDAREQLFGLPR